MISIGIYTNQPPPLRAAMAEFCFLSPTLGHRSTTPDITLVFQNEASVIGNWAGQFTSMERLRDGWDGYCAPPPSEPARGAAKNFLASLIGRGFQPSRLAPSVVGGVGLTRWKGERQVYVEFYNEGTVYALFSDGVGEPISHEVRLGHQQFVELIEEMREYLDG